MGDGDFEEVLLVCGVMLHHGWLLLYWIIAGCAPINFFWRLFYQTIFFLALPISKKINNNKFFQTHFCFKNIQKKTKVYF